MHVVSSDKNIGYGKAAINMTEVFRKTGSSVNVMVSAKGGPAADIDFFLKPPPWNPGRAKRRIAHFYWEAIPLPRQWSCVINTVNEIWAPCPLVATCCKEAGFKGRIEIVPTPALPMNYSDIPDIKFKGINKDSFVFYSIFQWHNRKGWKELLSAYFEEFTSSDNVCLVIKTNPINHMLQDQIVEDVRLFKSNIKNKDTAPLMLIPSIISEKELLSIHKAGHCYVAPHHGEGWGMPIHDAILAGKQIIATKFGGVVEYLDDKSFHPIPFTMAQVTDMDWNGAYNSTQQWAQPNVSALMSIMRDVYANHKLCIDKNMLINKNIEQLSFGGILNLINGLI